MIPSDVANRLLPTTDATVAAVPSAQQVSDALAQLAPGQRVLAEIQALLPNGAYRALINQRDFTLALPFSAKAGDTLELQVVDNNGRLALAVLGARGGDVANTAAGEAPAVTATLSRAGSLIASLLDNAQAGGKAPPAALNAQQAIAAAPPQRGSDIAPLLKQAITQSGLFYESHQSGWIAAQTPLSSLLAEPQGQLSPRLAASTPSAPAAADGTAPAAKTELAVPTAHAPALPAGNLPTLAASRPEASTASLGTTAGPAGGTPTDLVAQHLLPLVQQQLEALATQTYAWQGIAWPGQPMQWEIVEDEGQGQGSGSDAPGTAWQTKLTLTLPAFGTVQASLRLHGGDVSVALRADDGAAAAELNAGGSDLRGALADAGLQVVNFAVSVNDTAQG